MDSLIELVFECTPKDKVIELLVHLICDAERIAGIDNQENIQLVEEGVLNKEAVESIINFASDASILLRLENMKIDSIILPLVLLRLVKYHDQYDIDFNFNLNDIHNIDVNKLIEVLHNYVTTLAKENGVESWFAGIEPASDEDTRYFTNEGLGPLSLERLT